LVAEADQLAVYASVAPGRVLPGHPQYQRRTGSAMGGRPGCRRG
jgi:hypothetical protein